MLPKRLVRLIWSGAWRRAALLLSALVLLWLAAVPAAAAPTGADIVGMWQGTLTIARDNESATYPLTMTVTADGTVKVNGIEGAELTEDKQMWANVEYTTGQIDYAHKKVYDPNAKAPIKEKVPLQGDKHPGRAMPFRYQNGGFNVDKQLCYVAGEKRKTLTLAGQVTQAGAVYTANGTGALYIPYPNGDIVVKFTWKVSKSAAPGAGTTARAGAAEVSGSTPGSAPRAPGAAPSQGTVPGLGGVGDVPGPATATQAAVGVLLPALLGMLGGLWGGAGTATGGTLPPLSGPSSPAPPPVPAGPMDGESRVYRDDAGRNYDVRYDAKAGEWINTESGTYFDPDRFKAWQTELARDKADGQQDLAKMAARQTAFDKQADALVTQQKTRSDTLTLLGKMDQAAITQGLWNPGGPGDVIGNLDRIAANVMDGKPADAVEVDKIKKVIKDRIAGTTADEITTIDAIQETRNLDAHVATALGKTAQEVITGRKDDDSFSALGTTARILTGALTGGASEKVFVPADAYFRAENAINREKVGQESSGVLSTVAMSVVATGGSLLDHMIIRDVGRGVDFVAKQAAGRYPSLNRAIAVGMEDATSATGKTLTKTAETTATSSAGQGAATAVDAELEAHKQAMKAALAESGDKARTEAVKALYRDGGRAKLAKLEQAGHLTADQAAACNKVITTEVNKAIDTGVKDAIKDFHEKTGVQIQEVLVGDSGSSSQLGKARSILTDADRTTVPTFNKASLDAYADKMKISTQEAHDRLSKLYADTMEDKVGQALEGRGLSKQAVDYKTYNRIGSTSGQADAYPSGLTSIRQSIGQTTRYGVVDGAGNVAVSKTSGQALLDQEAINRAAVSGRSSAIDEVIAKSTSQEYPGIIKQQVMAVTDHTDPKSVAKALERTQRVAERLGTSVDPEIISIAEKIKRAPQQTSNILAEAGMTAEEFHARGFAAIKGFSGTIAGG